LFNLEILDLMLVIIILTNFFKPKMLKKLKNLNYITYTINFKYYNLCNYVLYIYYNYTELLNLNIY
jgi:hypothetical protein